MTKCGTCKNAIFNELWGEYKCKARGTTAPRDYKERNRCELYGKGKPKIIERDDIFND